MSYTPTADVLDAARAVGARALWREPARRGMPPRVMVKCKDGWQAAKYLVELAKRDALRPNVIEAARILAYGARGAAEIAERVLAFVQQNIRFEREAGEIFQSPRALAESGVGDCDCHARTVYALLSAAGVRVRMAVLYPKDGKPRHVVVEAFLPGRGWTWLESTAKATMGEHPIAAVRRLKKQRVDVASGARVGVKTMGDSGLIGLVQGAWYVLTLEDDTTGSAIEPLGELEAKGFGSPRWTGPGTVVARWELEDAAVDPVCTGFAIASARATSAPPDTDGPGPTIGAQGEEEPGGAPHEVTPGGEDPPAAPAPVTGLTRHIAQPALEKLVALTARLDPSAAHFPYTLALIIQNESGWDPALEDHFHTDHRGLIQFGRTERATLEKELGRPFPFDDVLSQLDFVEAFYRGWRSRAMAGGGWKTPGRVYLTAAAPALLANPAEDFPIYVAPPGGCPDDPKKAAQFNYCANRGLDMNGDGEISLRDLDAVVAKMSLARDGKTPSAFFVELSARIRQAGAGPAPEGPSLERRGNGFAIAVGILLGIGAAAGAAYAAGIRV